MTQPAPDSAGDFFRGFGTTSIRGGGNFYMPGVYDVTILALLRKTSENPSKGGNKIVICEATIDTVVTAYPADQGTAPVGQVPDWGASNQRGEKVSYIQDLTKHHAMAMGNVKGLLLAILNVRNMERALAAPGGALPELLTEKSLTPEAWEQAIAMATSPPGKWAEGVRLRAHVGKTRTLAKKPFSPVSWVPLVPGATAPAGT